MAKPAIESVTKSKVFFGIERVVLKTAAVIFLTVIVVSKSFSKTEVTFKTVITFVVALETDFGQSRFLETGRPNHSGVNIGSDVNST